MQLIFTLDGGPAADAEDLARLGHSLRHDLRQLDVDAVEVVRRGDAPAGAKGDPISLATLAVTLGSAALTSVFGLLQTWLTRNDKCTVTLEDGDRKRSLTGTPSEEQRKFIETMIQHQGSAASKP